MGSPGILTSPNSVFKDWVGCAECLVLLAEGAWAGLSCLASADCASVVLADCPCLLSSSLPCPNCVLTVRAVSVLPSVLPLLEGLSNVTSPNSVLSLSGAVTASDALYWSAWDAC